jgi:hypothetical protein
MTPQREAEIVAGRTEYRSTADLDRDIADLHVELKRVRGELAQAIEHRDYWHREAMSATTRIVELESERRDGGDR